MHNTNHVRPPDTLAQGSLGNAAGALAPATPTTRRLAAHSVSANTRAAYRCALRQFDTWRGAAPATDATLAAYLGWLFEQGRAPATAALGVAAVTFRATLAGTPVRGPQTDRVLAGFRRDGADRGRGQAAPLRADGLAAILATADRPRVTGRGREAGAVAARRGALDTALAAVLFQGGLRRGDAAALEWRDVAPATTAGAILVTVRRSKTDQEGTAADVRYLKSGAAVGRPRPPPRRPRADRPRLWRPDAPAARAPLHRRRRRRRAPRAAHRAQRPGGAGLGTHRARRVHHRRDARRGVENRADGRALQRRGHRGTRRGRALPVAPGATGRPARDPCTRRRRRGGVASSRAGAASGAASLPPQTAPAPGSISPPADPPHVWPRHPPAWPSWVRADSSPPSLSSSAPHSGPHRIGVTPGVSCHVTSRSDSTW